MATKPGLSDEERKLARQANAAKASAARKGKKFPKNKVTTIQSTEPDPMKQDPAPSSTPEETITQPPTSAAPSGEDVVMDVPDITQISSFASEPKIEAHVSGSQPAQHTSPPITDDGNGPPPPPPDQPFSNEPTQPPFTGAGSSSSENPNGPQPGNAQGNTITPEQAAKTFDEAVRSINYGIRNQIGPFLAVKPEKYKEYKAAMDEMKAHIKRLIDDYNTRNTESLVLNQEDIDMLREPAIAVLQEEGLKMTNRQLLMAALIQVGLSKVRVIAQMFLNKKHVIAEMKMEIANGVAAMDHARQSAQDILNNVAIEKESLRKQREEMEILHAELQKMARDFKAQNLSSVVNPVPVEHRSNGQKHDPEGEMAEAGKIVEPVM